MTASRFQPCRSYSLTSFYLRSVQTCPRSVQTCPPNTPGSKIVKPTRPCDVLKILGAVEQLLEICQDYACCFPLFLSQKPVLWKEKSKTSNLDVSFPDSSIFTRANHRSCTQPHPFSPGNSNYITELNRRHRCQRPGNTLILIVCARSCRQGQASNICIYDLNDIYVYNIYLYIYNHIYIYYIHT